MSTGPASTGKAAASAFATPTITRAQGGVLQRKCDCGQHTGGGECEECKKKQPVEISSRDPLLQRSALNRGSVKSVPPIVHEVLRSPGQPLDAAARAYFEPRFGRDFSRVRVHACARAAESARAVNALAYTVGRSVVFGTGQYAPGIASGRSLLAHELTHTIQQDFAAPRSGSPLRVTEPTDSAEHEAAVAASAVLGNGKFSLSAGQGPRLARYGHTWSCKDDAHLGPFIWPGHDAAKQLVARAAQETGGSALDPQTKAVIERFFGKTASDPANLAKIHGTFLNIQKALGEQYLYHCSGTDARADSDAIACKGQNAETSRSGNHDITLCFNRIRTWWTPGDVNGAAWLIIHENLHRAGTWGHTWEAGHFDTCLNSPPAPFTGPDVDNADAYACSAAIIGTSKKP
jgi:Domain of unknown function (DUF4157)